MFNATMRHEVRGGHAGRGREAVIGEGRNRRRAPARPDFLCGGGGSFLAERMGAVTFDLQTMVSAGLVFEGWVSLKHVARKRMDRMIGASHDIGDESGVISLLW